MPRLFTVKWPFLARLDAVLLFPVALILAAEIDLVRGFIVKTVTPAFPSVVVRLGFSKEATFWLELAVIGFVPFVLLLILADRLLTVRKGFALLAVVALGAWCAVALDQATRLAAMVPTRIAGEVTYLGTGRHAAFAACGMALLLHLRPLWIGLRDQGEVAMRMMERTFGPGYAPDQKTRSRYDRDVYYRQTSEFRGWRPQQQLEGSGGVPKEGPGLRFMFGVAWVGIMAGLGFAWLHWGSWGSGGHQAIAPGVVPGIETGQTGTKTTMHPAALAAIYEPPITPPVRSAPDRQFAQMALPSVQRPSEMPSDPYSGGGANEAVAMRGRDGGFAFDAVINGAHVSMLFDTGASVVALRAEEAERFGISLSNLNYSAKVKTANGVSDVAPVIIDTIRIGNITQRHVIGYVARQGMLPRNLLGQTFLAGLSGYHVENDKLVLRGH